ncbi:hypothetical protein CONPUDRAFT_169399 [Coniophora puteana RWD-64-598 SS2]|uniref:F-box domain-containing protein n=1 Tax=Coniophora puteana (strain RWD-64-598) TaxID=741705 RepID=A0A5M3M9Z4_CONPW|nr:uncharacterized protein CONPUDRAFT_169399 [Coniophora puteana RWD-64-598 SS2]EIW75610.1 hypothetical protein CONPUDRAFT_169399 [Coniophora puteana RWD-64-598 SS2]
MLDTLPTEVLYKVLSHLEVVDLVHLERLAANVSNATIPEIAWFLPGHLGVWPDPCLLFGRWILARTETGVICFDVDARIPYECWLLEVSPGFTFEHLHCASHTCAEGQYAYALVEEKEDVSGDTTVKVFKIELNDDFPPKLIPLIDLPAPQSKQSKLFIGPKTLVISLGYVDGDEYFHPYDGIWVMDIIAEKFYRLQSPERKGGYPEGAFTRSQIYVGLTYFVVILYKLFGSTELVEAFELPILQSQDTADTFELRILQPSHRSPVPRGLYLATSIFKAIDPLRGSVWSDALTFPAWLCDESLIVSACDASSLRLAEDVDLVRISFPHSPPGGEPASIHFQRGCFSGMQSMLPGARSSYFSDDNTAFDAEEARFLVEGVSSKVGVDETELFGLTIAFPRTDGKGFPHLRKITCPSQPVILHDPESVACFDGARGLLVVIRRTREGSVLQIIDIA